MELNVRDYVAITCSSVLPMNVRSIVREGGTEGGNERGRSEMRKRTSNKVSAKKLTP